MAFQRPGVYVQETLNPVQPIAGTNSEFVTALVGENDRGPINTPSLVTSWNQYVTLFGSWNSYTNNSLPLAVYMFFSNGGSQLYVTRIAAAPGLATRSLNDRAVSASATLQVAAKNPGRWGNDLNISIANFFALSASICFSTCVFIEGAFTAFIHADSACCFVVIAIISII